MQLDFLTTMETIRFRLREQTFTIDPVLLTATVGLLMFGFVMVTSASLHLGDKMANDSFYYPKHQLVHIIIGLLAAATVLMVPLHRWQQWAPFLLIAGIGLLVLVLVPGIGKHVKGSSRWLVLGGMRIQVSEIIKLASIIYVASYIHRRLHLIRSSLLGILYPLGLLTIAAFFLLLEPDFGAAAVMMATALGMLFLAGAQLWIFSTLIAVVGILGGILIYSSPYRLARVLSFTNPWADPLDSGFQLTQALIAFGRGEWIGVGLGASVQKLFYLPEAHTDFLFSIIGEELGLMGAIAVIALFSLIVWRAFLLGRQAEQANLAFAAYIAYGIGLWFGMQAFVNMGVNMGILPTKGLTLPLMSYGGGSMIIMCCAVAFLFRVGSEINIDQEQRKSSWQHVS